MYSLGTASGRSTLPLYKGHLTMYRFFWLVGVIVVILAILALLGIL